MINNVKTLTQLNVDISQLKSQSAIKVYWNLRPPLTSTNIKRSNVVDADALKLAKTNLGIEIN